MFSKKTPSQNAMKTPTISTTSKQFAVQKNVSGILWERIHPLLLPKVLLYESYRYLFRHLYLSKRSIKNKIQSSKTLRRYLSYLKIHIIKWVGIKKTTSKKLKASTSTCLWNKHSKFSHSLISNRKSSWVSIPSHFDPPYHDPTKSGSAFLDHGL